MPNPDTAVSIHPYFEVAPENLEAFNALLPQFISRAQTEPDCLYYGFTQSGNIIHCREGYKNAEGLLFHSGNVGELIEKALGISKIVRVEIHGPAGELEKLKEPFAAMPVEYYELKLGFRN